MKQYKLILFDLDGTISNPMLGIVNSVMYACEKMNVSKPNPDHLASYIGPPMQDTMAEVFHLNEEETNRMIGYYRDYFKEKGMFENDLYEYIPQLLKSLKSQGKQIAIATSKPTVFAEKIMEYFELHSYVDLIAGSNLDGSRRIKSEIIEFVLEQFPESQKGDIVMIGDRKEDIKAAECCGIDSIGVTYGFGTHAELSAAKPNFLIETVEELHSFLALDKERSSR